MSYGNTSWINLLNTGQNHNAGNKHELYENSVLNI
jgi:hypothetical protein